MAYENELHDQVFRELMMEFNQNTTMKTDATADAELKYYLEHKLFKLLDRHQIEWGGKARKFVRSCAAGLARASERCSQLTRNPDVITADAIKLALVGDSKVPKHPGGLIHDWERVCPLPTSDGISIMLGCCMLRERLGMTVEEACVELRAKAKL